MSGELRATWLLVGVIVLLLSCDSAPRTIGNPSPPQTADARVFDFEEGEIGKVPRGFTTGLTGGGGPVRWEVREATDAPSGRKVVAQLSADRKKRRYPVLISDEFLARDLEVSVRFKTLSGKVDASGGIVWRYQDEGNYYVARANALEGNVVAYKTEKSKRSSIGVKGKGNAYGVKAEVPHREWNTLRVIAKGNLFEIHLNGRKLFEVENDTFQGAGKVGLWTKADAVTEFDDLRVTNLDESR